MVPPFGTPSAPLTSSSRGSSPLRKAALFADDTNRDGRKTRATVRKINAARRTFCVFINDAFRAKLIHMSGATPVGSGTRADACAEACPTERPDGRPCQTAETGRTALERSTSQVFMCL